jgi:hypothetical protein
MTLEQKIRELVPSLQDLKTGVPVMYKKAVCLYMYSFKDRFDKEIWTLFEARYRTHQVSPKYCKVIGHPIQLHHVLTAISRTPGADIGMGISGDGITLYMYEKIEAAPYLCWDLTESLEGQSEETKKFLEEILLANAS